MAAAAVSGTPTHSAAEGEAGKPISTEGATTRGGWGGEAASTLLLAVRAAALPQSLPLNNKHLIQHPRNPPLMSTAPPLVVSAEQSEANSDNIAEDGSPKGPMVSFVGEVTSRPAWLRSILPVDLFFFQILSGLLMAHTC